MKGVGPKGEPPKIPEEPGYKIENKETTSTGKAKTDSAIQKLFSGLSGSQNTKPLSNRTPERTISKKEDKAPEPPEELSSEGVEEGDQFLAQSSASEEPQVRLNPSTGDWETLNPETGKWEK